MAIGAGDGQDSRTGVAILDDQLLYPVIDARLSRIGKDPLRAETGLPVEATRPFALVGIEGRIRWIGRDGRVVGAIGEGEVLEVELVAPVPVDLEVVRLPIHVAVQLEPVSDPDSARSVRREAREDAPAARHPSAPADGARGSVHLHALALNAWRVGVEAQEGVRAGDVELPDVVGVPVRGPERRAVH